MYFPANPPQMFMFIWSFSSWSVSYIQNILFLVFFLIFHLPFEPLCEILSSMFVQKDHAQTIFTMSLIISAGYFYLFIFQFHVPGTKVVETPLPNATSHGEQRIPWKSTERRRWTGRSNSRESDEHCIQIHHGYETTLFYKKIKKNNWIEKFDSYHSSPDFLYNWFF